MGAIFEEKVLFELRDGKGPLALENLCANTVALGASTTLDGMAARGSGLWQPLFNLPSYQKIHVKIKINR